MANVPPLFLWVGQNYCARHPLSAQNLLRLARGLRIRQTLREKLAELRCRLFGHDLALDRWHRADNPRWFQQMDYEIHLGCRRCRFVLVLPPELDDVGTEHGTRA